MEFTDAALLQEKCGPDNYQKLALLNNERLNRFVAEYIRLCNPSSIFVRTDAPEDAQYIRDQAIATAEEQALAVPGHTVHFDGYYDQARDKKNTKFLVDENTKLGTHINSIDRQQGLNEIRELLRNSMEGKQAYVLFFCLGPVRSPFSIYAVQITDSSYVAHSEDILYRPAYEVFREGGAGDTFFAYVHSAGELKDHVSANVDQRRVYIDSAQNIVYSVNTQYGGNTIGLKKLSLRLAIRKADREGWLAEHMFVMAVHGPESRKTYFTGAYPSFCGKTSTCMVQGEQILGDDIAYLRRIDDRIRATNVERGIFGIIRDVNAEADPLIWQALTTPGEVIFSNVLINQATPHWPGDGRPLPENGQNHSGAWFEGKTDAEGNPIPPAHPNARYTVPLERLSNADPRLHDPRGVEVGGLIYGGRDSDTSPPVFQSFDWTHGVITIAASLESETTAATLGQQGVRKFNPMANLDFLSIPIGRYITDYLEFVRDLPALPAIFGVNYFLRDEQGTYLTGIQAKRVWLKWMERRVHGEVEVITSPMGYIPLHQDLQPLFQQVLGQDYTIDDYTRHFAIRVPENLAKFQRMLTLYQSDVADTPPVVLETLQAQHRRLKEAQSRYGDYISPLRLA